MWEPSQKLHDGVMALAHKWSKDNPSYKNDLYQEAMLSIWRKGECDAPWSYQLKTAQNRMLSVRKLGKSVDGKLDHRYKRETRYYVTFSLEQDGVNVGDSILPFEAMLPDPFRVEEYVVAKLTLLEIISFLEPWERRCTALLCQGFSLREIAIREHLPYQSLKKRLAGMRTKLKDVLQEAVA